MQVSKYVPDWKIGDVFSHRLTYPAAEALGISGWVIILYKVGEYTGENGESHQLAYVSLCPPDKVPSCPEELQNLGFLPMMHNDRMEYLAQLTVTSKKSEEAYGLTKFGFYPNVDIPGNPGDENPLTAMPLFGCLRKSDKYPGYEDQICRLYRKYGHMLNL